MKALGLLVVLVFAHTLMVVGREIPASAWTLPGLYWQDAGVALLFGAAAYLLRTRPRIAWTLYGVLAGYAAVNVPLAWVLSSPLTIPMLRAARGALRDSVAHHFSVQNLGAVLAVGLVAGLMAWVTGRRTLGLRAGMGLVACGLAVAMLGPYAVSRSGAGGLHRNAFGALWPVRLSASPPSPDREDWRVSPFGSRPAMDLSALRGAAAGRNVVLVLLESTGSLYLEPWGAGRDPMPYLTALSERSLVFETAYAAYPESIKGLLPVLCSVWPAFGVSAEAYAGFPCRPIARVLSGEGYRTGLVHSGRFDYLGMQGIVEAQGFDLLADAGDISGNDNSSFGVDEPAAIDAIFGWIDSLARDERFFLTYLPIAGHHPYATPETGPFPPDSDFGRYLNALTWSDKALGALLDGLAARGLYENTVFVVFGDHGEAFGEREGNFGHSFFIYETNVRIPYLIAMPGVTDTAVRVPTPISVIDTAPTLLELLGIAVPEEYDGASVLDGEERMALFYTDYALGWLGLYDACWKYILETDSGRSQLYDVCRDRGETEDRAAGEPERVEAYRQRVEAWARAQVAAFDPQ